MHRLIHRRCGRNFNPHFVGRTLAFLRFQIVEHFDVPSLQARSSLFRRGGLVSRRARGVPLRWVNDGATCDLREVHEPLLRSPLSPCAGTSHFPRRRWLRSARIAPRGQGAKGKASLHDQVCGAKQQRRSAVSPLAEAVVPRSPLAFCEHREWPGHFPFTLLGRSPAGIFCADNIMAEQQ